MKCPENRHLDFLSRCAEELPGPPSPGPFPFFAEEGPGDDLRYTSDENKAQQMGLLGALFVLGTKDHCISSVHGQVFGLSERPTPLQSILDPIFLGKSLLGKCYFRDPN